MLLIKTKIACDKIVIYFTQSLLCARHFAEHFVHISHLIFTTNLRSMYNGHHFIAGKLIHTHLVNCDWPSGGFVGYYAMPSLSQKTAWILRGKVNKIKMIHFVTFYQSNKLNLMGNHRSMWNILTSFNINMFPKAFNFPELIKWINNSGVSKMVF